MEKSPKKIYRPGGFNLGINIGEASGAGVADHIHLHVVPRWSGDTNFILAVADTRVLPEALGETYRRISEAWNSLFLQSNAVRAGITGPGA